MKNRLAFTLLEIILTIIIIALALLPIFSSYSNSHTNTKATLEEVISVSFASELMEAIQALPFKQIPLLNSELIFKDGEFNPNPFSIAAAEGNTHGIVDRILPPNFKIHAFIDSYPTSGKLIEDSNLLLIKITLGWGLRNREVVLTTLKGRY